MTDLIVVPLAHWQAIETPCTRQRFLSDHAGLQGGFVGLDQVNVLLPSSLAGSGDVTIQYAANGQAANPVSLTGPVAVPI